MWLETATLPESLPSTVAVGWSGGADSTALLLALAGSGYRVHAWHVDHGWHNDSAGLAAQLAEKAAAWDVPFSVHRLPAPSGTNREAEARSGRYNAFVELSRQQGIDVLCLAHHRDDQAETVCMRMLQGAGVHGMRGMQPVRMHGDLRLVRPFLHLPASELRHALRRAGVSWFDDRSNEDTALWRNRLRRRFFPALKSAGIDPMELYMRWQHQAKMVAGELDAGLDGIDLYGDESSCSMEWSQWQRLTPELRATLLQRMMGRLFGQACVAGRRHIELVEAWMTHGGSGGVDLSRSRLMRKNGSLLLTKKMV